MFSCNGHEPVAATEKKGVLLISDEAQPHQPCRYEVSEVLNEVLKATARYAEQVRLALVAWATCANGRRSSAADSPVTTLEPLGS